MKMETTKLSTGYVSIRRSLVTGYTTAYMNTDLIGLLEGAKIESQVYENSVISIYKNSPHNLTLITTYYRGKVVDI